ncbi:hypothetical protein M9458_010043, partial [Cirrhinus mrigala]
ALTDAKGEGGKIQDPEENKLLKKEVQRLTEELKSSTDGEHRPYRDSTLILFHNYNQTNDLWLFVFPVALKKSKSDLDTMKKQTEGLTKEYDRLLQEHQELQ